MRIGLVASIWISLPPKNFGFGAQEYLEYYIAEGLQKKGHEVTVFASADSKTSTKLVSVTPKQVEDLAYPDVTVKMHFELLNAHAAFKQAQDFDIIHNHLLPYGLFFPDLVKTPVVHTLHHEIHHDRSDAVLYETFKSQPYISISDTQRKTFPDLNYIKTVYNGIDTSYYETTTDNHDDYLLYLGRMKRYKGIHIAIQIAKELGKKLLIVSPIPTKTQPDFEETNEYWEKDIKPHIGHGIEFMDAIGGKEKVAILQKAKALLFPVEREEPFGMTVIEAMSCGTPVVSYAMGAMPELIADGKTGYLVNRDGIERGNWTITHTGIQGLTQAVERLYTMSDAEYQAMGQLAREHVTTHFSIESMVNHYEEAYLQVLES